MINVAINGAGRIGLLYTRIVLSNIKQNKSNFKIVAINDPFADADNILYRLTYDSTHGKFDGVTLSKDSEGNKVLKFEKEEIKLLTERDPKNIKYNEHGIQAVIECTGCFTTYEKASLHMHDSSVKKVIISAPASGDQIKTIVYGVNDKEYEASKHHVISNASCTTNCLAPIVKVLHDKYGVETGVITTTHATTATQKTVDGACTKDFRSGRAASTNIIPASTGAAKAIGKVFPDLEGKLDGIALRVPTTNVSVTDCVFKLKKEAKDKAEIQKAFRDQANGDMKNILEIAHEHAVSSDFNGNPASSIVQFENMMLMDNNRMFKTLSFYDNEWGYSNRLFDLTNMITKNL